MKKNVAADKMLDFSGKTVLITGAASGIGRDAAIRFSELDANLVIIDIDEEGLIKTKELCKTNKVDNHILDLSSKKNISSFWRKLAVTPDVIVNNAGIYPFIKFKDLTEEELHKVLDVNQNSVFWMCQEFVKKKKKNGVIVNISSIEAILPFKKDMAHYTAGKSGVIALTRSLAHDYARNGFRANVVLPGAIKTPTTRGLVKAAATQVNFRLMKVGYDFGTRLPMGRWGKSDEVAKVIIFLSSDMASYVNGAKIPVDGGFLSS